VCSLLCSSMISLLYMSQDLQFGNLNSFRIIFMIHITHSNKTDEPALDLHDFICLSFWAISLKILSVLAFFLSFFMVLFYLEVSRGFYLWIYRQLVGFLGWVIGPTQGLYLHRTTQHRETQTHTHAPSRIRTCDLNIRATDDRTCLRPLGYWDRLLAFMELYLDILLLISENLFHKFGKPGPENSRI
jgi:hypothetical protein